MKDVSKRERMKDVLKQLVNADDEERAVVADHTSRVAGPSPYEAGVTKMLCDSLNKKLQPVGLILKNATLGWRTDKSAEEVCAELRRIGLITQRSVAEASLDSLS
jgi:hypothetical protein